MSVIETEVSYAANDHWHGDRGDGELGIDALFRRRIIPPLTIRRTRAVMMTRTVWAIMLKIARTGGPGAGLERRGTAALHAEISDRGGQRSVRTGARRSPSVQRAAQSPWPAV